MADEQPVATDDTPRRRMPLWRKLLIGSVFVSFTFLVLVIVLVLVVDEPEDAAQRESVSRQQTAPLSDDQAKPTQAQKESPTFPFTVGTFITRYNMATDTLESDTRVQLEDENDNGEFIVVELHSNKNLALLLTADRESRAVSNIVYIAGGTGTLESGVDVIVGAAATLMAIDNKYMHSSDERGAAIKKIGLLEVTDLPEKGKTTVLDGTRYYLSFSDAIGVMLSVEPVGDR